MATSSFAPTLGVHTHDIVAERSELIQAVIDRLLYCEGYRTELLALNQQFTPQIFISYADNRKSEPGAAAAGPSTNHLPHAA